MGRFGAPSLFLAQHRYPGRRRAQVLQLMDVAGADVVLVELAPRAAVAAPIGAVLDARRRYLGA